MIPYDSDTEEVYTETINLRPLWIGVVIAVIVVVILFCGRVKADELTYVKSYPMQETRYTFAHKCVADLEPIIVAEQVTDAFSSAAEARYLQSRGGWFHESDAFTRRFVKTPTTLHFMIGMAVWDGMLLAISHRSPAMRCGFAVRQLVYSAMTIRQTVSHSEIHNVP